MPSIFWAPILVLGLLAFFTLRYYGIRRITKLPPWHTSRAKKR